MHYLNYRQIYHVLLHQFSFAYDLMMMRKVACNCFNFVVRLKVALYASKIEIT